MRLLIIVKNTSNTSFSDALMGMRCGKSGIHNQINFIFLCILKKHDIVGLYFIVQERVILINTVVRKCAKNPDS